MAHRAATAVLLLLAIAASAVEAQETRASLIRQATAAYDDFNPTRALQLARTALDPALGPPDTLWTRGVHLLAQVLIEGGDEPLARTWARWAIRTHPRMTIDSVNFLAGVVATLRQARDSVRTRTSGDEVTRMAWQWASRTSSETQGRIRLDPSIMPVPVNVLVRTVGVLPAGPGLSLAPGSYEIEVGAPGYLPARIVREILPGITLTLSFQLTSAAVASETIAENIRQAVYRATTPLTLTRFGTTPGCAAGVFVGGRLILTSYAAIRGASEVATPLGGGAAGASTGQGAGIRVAAYDATSNIAVLQVPAARTDSVVLSSSIIDGQAVWGIGLAQCRTLTDTRSVVDEWMQRPLGALRLSERIAQGTAGAPVVDYRGRLAGVFTADTVAIPAPNAASLLELARRNVGTQQTMAVADVARRENHVYGSLTVTSDVAGAAAKLTPLERWHWPELATVGATPFSFSGPIGRYRLEVTSAGMPSRTQEVTIRAGEAVRVMVPLRTVAAATGPAQPAAKKGIPKWVWYAVGGGGVAVAAALGGGGGGTKSTVGTITVRVPAQ